RGPRDHEQRERREHEEDGQCTGHHDPSYASTQSVRPSTRATRARSPRRSVRAPAVRTVHVVPRSSPFPTPPGATSSSSTVSCPTSESTVAGSPAAAQRTRRPRRGTRHETDTTVKISHSSHSAPPPLIHDRAAVPSGPTPKNRK